MLVIQHVSLLWSRKVEEIAANNGWRSICSRFPTTPVCGFITMMLNEQNRRSERHSFSLLNLMNEWMRVGFRSSAGIMIRHWKGFIIWIYPSRLDSFDSFRKNGIIVFRCVPVFSDVYIKVCSINLHYRSSVALCFVGPCSLGYFRVQSETFCGSWSIFFDRNEHFLLFSGKSRLSQTNLIEWSQCCSSLFSLVCISLLLNRWLRCSLPMYHDWFNPMSTQRTSTAARPESKLFRSWCDHPTTRHM